MRVCAIIAAAGSGRRMGAGKNKLLLKVGDKTVIEKTAEAFQKNENIDAIVIVSEIEEIKEIAKNYSKVIAVVPGGDTRQKSVYGGMMAAKDYDILAVHDGARCFVSQEIISDAVQTAKDKGACVPVIDVIDTVKNVDGDIICGSVDRESIKAIQTPQCFKSELLFKAYEMGDGNETDESSLVSKVANVYTCQGSRENIKITTKYDLLIADAILKGEENCE